jgi:D-lactate dehydrogenase (cytochrome)
VIETLQAGIPIARVELLDAGQIAACNAYSGLDLPVAPHLFVEFHGTDAGTAEQAELFQAIAEGHGGARLAFVSRPEDRSRIWKARHDAFWAAVATPPGSRGGSTDICVPISRLADCVAETRADMEEHGIPGTMLGHVGDGNFHAIPLVNPDDPEEVARLEAFLDRLAERAHRVGGTCTGEHGIGQGRRRYMTAEFGPDLVGAMRAVKAALDPLGIMNPGKTLPDPE